MATKQEFESYAWRFIRMAQETQDIKIRRELLKVAEAWWSMADEQEAETARQD